MILVLGSQSAFGQELFGSIAYSPSARHYGWANNQPSRDAADKQALGFCRRHAEDCTVVLWFRNACGALITAPDGHWASWDDSQTAAVNKALKACTTRSSACAVTYTFCTDHKRPAKSP